MKTAFFCFTGFILLLQNCNKGCFSKGIVEYNFQLPLTITPARDTFSIGDTIWLIADIDDNLLDLTSNSRIQLKQFEFYAEFEVARIDVAPFQFADLDFDYYTEVGELEPFQFSDHSWTHFIHFHYENNRYQLKTAIVPRHKGTYYVVFTSAFPYPDRNRVKVTSSDKDEYVYVEYQTNEEADNNYYLTQSSPDSTIRQVDTKSFRHDGTYAFVIR